HRDLHRRDALALPAGCGPAPRALGFARGRTGGLRRAVELGLSPLGLELPPRAPVADRAPARGAGRGEDRRHPDLAQSRGSVPGVDRRRVRRMSGRPAGDSMNLALFDFDGTITHRDTFTPFLRFAVRPERMALARIFLSPLIA